MDYIKFISYLPQLFNWFAPGFISMALYKHFVDTQEKDFEITFFGSIVYSYVFQLLSKAICLLFNKSTTGYMFTLITFFLSFVLTIVFVRIRLTSFFKKCLSYIGKTTGSKSIWYDFFNLNKGTRVRFYAKFNHEDVVIEGNIKYFEPCGSGECNMVIDKYKIQYDDNSTYKGLENATMIFNSQNIYGIEALCGQ